MKPIEERLWDYLDGKMLPGEKGAFEQLLQSDPAVKQLYEELLDIHLSLQAAELDEPSMRFTKNVMDAVALEPAPRALNTRIDKRIINAIAAFFILTLSALVLFTISLMSWSSSLWDLSLPLPEIAWTNYFNSAYVMGAGIIFILLTLYTADRYRQFRKNSKTALTANGV
jgi:anti-sigma factor RsiW